MDFQRRGFTLLEILVVTAIVFVLASLLTVAVQKVQGAALRTQSLNKLKNMGQAVHTFHDVYKRLPPAFGATGTSSNQTLSVHLMPYLEQDGVYLQVQPLFTIGPGAPFDAVVVPFLAQADASQKGGGGVQNFAANVRVFTDYGFHFGLSPASVPGSPIFQPVPTSGGGALHNNLSGTFLDGTSNVIIFANRFANNTMTAPEGNPDCSSWWAPPFTSQGAFFGQGQALGPASSTSSPQITFQLAPGVGTVYCADSAIPHSFNPVSLQVCLGDGTVRNIQADISPATWMRALQPNDASPLGSDWNN